MNPIAGKWVGRGAGQDRYTTLLQQSSKNSTTCMTALLLSVMHTFCDREKWFPTSVQVSHLWRKHEHPSGRGQWSLSEPRSWIWSGSSCLCPRLQVTVTYECIDGRNSTHCHLMCTICPEHHKCSRKLFKHTVTVISFHFCWSVYCGILPSPTFWSTHAWKQN